MIRIARIYSLKKEDKEKKSYRVLVDRLWPRGISKDSVDLWLKDIAPSDALRKWFSHDDKKWDGFKKRYFIELDGKQELAKAILEKEKQGPVTLLFAAKDAEHNNAVALLEYLLKRFNC
ncbi:MAG TPA: DUF488 family protein [Nitrososphaera sp.]|nr:DUF488 family protein [Nitrososphaera sp.]